MTVVNFPDEIHKKLLDRLNQSLRFKDYLNSLVYCAKKQLDQEPLASWWRLNQDKLESDNFELDFTLFLSEIVVSHRTWEQEKHWIQQQTNEREERKKKRQVSGDLETTIERFFLLSKTRETAKRGS
jgi:hypothetical protein